jgi:hypothetical protein
MIEFPRGSLYTIISTPEQGKGGSAVIICYLKAVAGSGIQPNDTRLMKEFLGSGHWWGRGEEGILCSAFLYAI